jgi:hypothetical protein
MRPYRQFDPDQLQRHVGPWRKMPADIAGSGVGPDRLHIRASKISAGSFSMRDQRRQGHVEAVEMRTSKAAVGLVSLRSIALSIAFDTPECEANSASDQFRLSRSVCTRAAILLAKSSTIRVICPIYRTGFGWQYGASGMAPTSLDRI